MHHAGNASRRVVTQLHHRIVDVERQLFNSGGVRSGSEPGVAKGSKPPFGVLGHRMAGKGSIPAVRTVWRQ
jgi:hypothetical protein